MTFKVKPIVLVTFHWQSPQPGEFLSRLSSKFSKCNCHAILQARSLNLWGRVGIPSETARQKTISESLTCIWLGAIAGDEA
ncbi:hypothetical protein A6X21_05615 [Planctopirus hydrillae]|uniref:Uncharacterized protein n=1 Tax=Planctopirus hydrillae TaxID=1841610 RepID=A0A1C3EBZ2_9PLAN|nr:hypothetical protein A6X21_05615 [Planctopirus hydrillae]